MRRVTGERVTTDEGGFGPTWHRHVAAYRVAATLLGDGPVLDLGCGVGHSAAALAPRWSVGVDLDQAALSGQRRATVRADMRRLPFRSSAFGDVVSVQSLEHVPDPSVVVSDVARVLDPDGTAVFVTPNRLTFGRPDEVIDPYHYVEYDRDQLSQVCRRAFQDVRVLGLFGSVRYLELVADEHARLDALLRKDPLRLRRRVPRRVRQHLYDLLLSRARRAVDPRAAAIGADDFTLGDDGVARSLDLVAVCRRPLR
jgi:SAM-dependent methyltransferase